MPVMLKRCCFLVVTSLFKFGMASTTEQNCVDGDVVLVKVGGSSITEKATRETLNPTALHWLSQTLASAISEGTLKPVIVHGAGSFGHHTAKDYGLSGQSMPPNTEQISPENKTTCMEGLSKTRLSVQSLNHQVVSSLIQHGIHSVGISPCFGIPGLQAHGGDPLLELSRTINDCVHAGLVPVIHGDACLYGYDRAGILGGDNIMEALGTSVDGLSRAIFLTDVEGVFTTDPRMDPMAQLIRTIDVDSETGKVLTALEASGSSHDHDVTGGLEAKLGAAATIAASGIDVWIVKCESKSAEQALHGKKDLDSGSIIRRARKN